MTSSQKTLTKALCPYCRGSSHLRVTARDFNRRVSNENFYLFGCNECGLMFIDNPPTDLGRYYPNDYHFSPNSTADLDPHLRSQQFKIELLKSFVSSGDLMEIGPSIGIFCKLAQNAGFKVSAIEMDETCVRFLREELDVRTIATTEPASTLASEQQFYDAICLWHSIEHLPCPWDVLEQAARRLKPGGVLVIAAPNPNSWQACLLGARWPHHDMPRHLFALPIPWLTKFGNKHGLTTVMVTTRDKGSLGWNRSTWAMVLRSLVGRSIFDGLVWRAGLLIGLMLEPWEGREGRGATYTVVLRRPTKT